MDEPRLRELEAKLEIYKSTLNEIYERYDQKLEELSLVRRVGDALRTTMTVESLASALMATVAHEVVADRLAMVLRDPADDPFAPLRLRASYNADREEFEFFPEGEGAVFDPGSLGPWSAGEFPRPRTIAEAAPGADPLASGDEGPRTILAAPFMVRDRLLGLLILSRPASQPFSAENGHMLSIMADQASAALANVQLFDDLSRINAKLIESERRALETSRYLERLLESANDAILTLDAKGLVTYANRKSGQWGWSRDDLLGKEFRSLLETDPSLGDWPSGGPPPVDTIVEATLTNQAGDRRTILISTSRVGEEGPDPAEAVFLIMVSDLTERRQLERQLLHSEKLASIGVLAAGVAHEVGNPLSAISGYAQILEAGVDSDAERSEYLTAILNQTDRILKILRELLDYSRPSRGLAETIDLAGRLKAVMGMLEGQRAFQRLKVAYEYDEGASPFLVTMDRDHFAQVIVIIAMNAAQAMEEQTDPEPVLVLSIWRDSGRIIIRIRDNGPGMSDEVKRRALDPFFTTKSSGEGTGLGLAICQRIVESYHGRLDLETAEGKGAAFTIDWPEAVQG